MPKSKPKWWHVVGIVAVLIIFSPLILLGLLWGMFYFFTVNLPILQTVESQPLYWLNWKEVKRKSDKSTMQVLSALHMFSAPSNNLVACSLRPETELIRLEKFLRRKRPYRPYPLSPHDAMFFQYRRRGGGRPRRLPLRFGALIPVRVRA